MQAQSANDQYHSDQTIKVLAALTTLGKQQGFEVEYVKGADCLDASFEELDKARAAALEVDEVIAYVGDTLKQNGEFHDPRTLTQAAIKVNYLKQYQPAARRLWEYLSHQNHLSCQRWLNSVMRLYVHLTLVVKAVKRFVKCYLVTLTQAVS